MKIAFDFITDETPLFVEVGKLLEKEGHEIFGLTLGKRWRTLWEGCFRTAPVSTVTGIVNCTHNLSEELARIEREYGIFKPSSFIHADRFICKFKRDDQIAILVDTFKSVELFFKRESPDIYFCTPISYLFNLVTHAVCKRLGIPHISLYITRGASPRFTYATNVSQQWNFVSDTYEKYLSGLLVIDKETIETAKEKLQNFRSSPHRPFYMKTARINYKFRMVFLKEFFTRLKYYFIDGWGRDRSDYMTKAPFWYAYRDAKRFLRAEIFSRFRKRIFDLAEQNVPYYLFPLNAQPEASTLIHAPWYVELINTIQNISQCIPLGAYLYVKEHTSAFGRRGLNFYSSIKRFHNVRLLGPWENTDSLIINSSGVIILSSTMGWEALLHGKPTYVLGDLFCNDISPLITVEGYANLRQRIYKDYHSAKAGPVVTDDKLIAFIAAMHAASYPGLIGPAKLDIRSTVLSDKNIRQVADGFKMIISHEFKEKTREEVKITL